MLAERVKVNAAPRQYTTHNPTNLQRDPNELY